MEAGAIELTHDPVEAVDGAHAVHALLGPA
jgi:hypothetical protein